MSLKKRTDRNKWQVSVKINGKRKRILFRTKLEAIDFERKHRLGEFGLVDKSPSLRFSDAFASYFETESFRKVQRSQELDRRIFNLAFHFFTEERRFEFIDQIQLDDLQLLERWLLLPHEGIKLAWSQSSVSRFSHTLKHFFVKMMRTRKLRENPSQYWTVSEGDPNKRRPMSVDEYEKLYCVSPEWFRPLLEFMRLTGARPSSVSRLKWADVDLVKRVLKLKSMKGRRAKRKDTNFPIYDVLFSLLVTERNKRPLDGPHDSVFKNESGLPITNTWISKEGVRLIKKSKLKGVCLYGLRHAMGTDLTEAGISLELTRKLMGHASATTTSHYTHTVGLKALSHAVEQVRSKEALSSTPIGTNREEGTA